MFLSLKIQINSAGRTPRPPSAYATVACLGASSANSAGGCLLLVEARLRGKDARTDSRGDAVSHSLLNLCPLLPRVEVWPWSLWFSLQIANTTHPNALHNTIPFLVFAAPPPPPPTPAKTWGHPFGHTTSRLSSMWKPHGVASLLDAYPSATTSCCVSYTGCLVQVVVVHVYTASCRRHKCSFYCRSSRRACEPRS